MALAPEQTGIGIRRHFTTEGVHPYDEITWEYRTAGISSESGKTVFEQKDVEVPAFWSQLATNVVVSKYFRGHVGTPEREHSVKQLIDRVVNTITAWADTQRYFDFHHAATDVFEGVNKRELELGAASMAVLIYLIDQHGLPNQPQVPPGGQ